MFIPGDSYEYYNSKRLHFYTSLNVWLSSKAKILISHLSCFIYKWFFNLARAFLTFHMQEHLNVHMQ